MFMLMERKKKSRFGIVKGLYNGTSSGMVNDKTKARRTTEIVSEFKILLNIYAQEISR